MTIARPIARITSGAQITVPMAASTGSLTAGQAVSSLTVTGPAVLYRPIEIASHPVVASDGTLVIDLALGSLFEVSMTRNITGITIRNAPTASNLVAMFTLVLVSTGNGAHVQNWPPVLWADDTAPTLTVTAGKRDVFSLVTYDAGVTYLGIQVSRNA